MITNKTRKIVMTALLAAMTCIATMVIQVPSPTGGYIHLGDGLVLLSGIILGPIYGGAAAGIGSMFADLLSGYGHFAPATLIIKALAAIIGGFVYHRIAAKTLSTSLISIVASGICGGIIVTTGYLIFESFLLGNGFAAAITGVPANIVQNIFGIAVSSFLMPFLIKTPLIKELVIGNGN